MHAKVYHASLGVAPLKRVLRPRTPVVQVGFPRRPRGGPIEAPRTPRRTTPRIRFPRRPRRGPIEAGKRLGGSSGPTPVFHAVLGVAPLKQGKVDEIRRGVCQVFHASLGVAPLKLALR